MQQDRSDSGAWAESAQGRQPPQFGPSKAAKERCQGVTKSGAACTAWPMEGGLCYFHANPAKASELGRRGGQGKSPANSGGTAQLLGLPLRTVDDVTALLAETINGLRSGSIDSRIANTVGYLATAMLKALQQGDIEGRLRAMEAVLSANKTPKR